MEPGEPGNPVDLDETVYLKTSKQTVNKDEVFEFMRDKYADGFDEMAGYINPKDNLHATLKGMAIDIRACGTGGNLFSRSKTQWSKTLKAAGRVLQKESEKQLETCKEQSREADKLTFREGILKPARLRLSRAVLAVKGCTNFMTDLETMVKEGVCT